MTQQLRRQIEAVLFAVGKKITVQELCKQLLSTPAKVRKELEALQQEYQDRDSAIMVSGGPDIWKLNVREEHTDLVRGLISSMELSKQTMETLAMIAYRAPVLQSDIIKARTNKAYDHIVELESMGFLNKEPEGRSKRIKLTQKFYEYFDIDPSEVDKIFAQFRDEEMTIAEQEQEMHSLLKQQKKVEKQVKKNLEEKRTNPTNLHDALDEIESESSSSMPADTASNSEGEHNSEENNDAVEIETKEEK